MNFDLNVSREEFDNALTQLKKSNNGKKSFDLFLEYDGTSLKLYNSLVDQSVPATGSADVILSLSGQVMLRMFDIFPTVETLHFSLNGNSLKIERLTIPCTIVGKRTQLIELSFIDAQTSILDKIQDDIVYSIECLAESFGGEAKSEISKIIDRTNSDTNLDKTYREHICKALENILSGLRGDSRDARMMIIKLRRNYSE